MKSIAIKKLFKIRNLDNKGTFDEIIFGEGMNLVEETCEKCGAKLKDKDELMKHNKEAHGM